MVPKPAIKGGFLTTVQKDHQSIEKKELPSWQFIVAALIILIAGWLWSQRLAEQALLKTERQLAANRIDFAPLIETKVASQNDPLPLVKLGRTLLSTNSPQLAIIPLQKATELSPRYRDAWYLLGYSYVQLANQAAHLKKKNEQQEALIKAKAALTEAQEIDASHQPTFDLLQELDQQLGT